MKSKRLLILLAVAIVAGVVLGAVWAAERGNGSASSTPCPHGKASDNCVNCANPGVTELPGCPMHAVAAANAGGAGPKADAPETYSGCVNMLKMASPTLTAEQKQKAEQCRVRLAAEIKRLGNETTSTRERLTALKQQKNPPADEVAALQAKLKDLYTQRRHAMATFSTNLLALLTAEQKAGLANAQQASQAPGMGGCGMGMGAGGGCGMHTEGAGGCSMHAGGAASPNAAGPAVEKPAGDAAACTGDCADCAQKGNCTHTTSSAGASCH